MVKRVLLLICVSAGMISVGDAAPLIPLADRHFDHDTHAAAVSKKGQAAANCSACHTMTPAGLPAIKGVDEHKRCFESCHEHKMSIQCSDRKAPMKTGGPLEDVCITCHPAGKSSCGMIPGAQSQPNKTSFEAKFAHTAKGHQEPELEKACARCHRGETKAMAQQPSGTGHAACSGCHGAAAKAGMATMKDCASCHVPLKGHGGHGRTDAYQLTPFDHAAHGATARQGACFSCHTPTSEKLPTKMLGCMQKCHDGSGAPGKAFSATGTTCTKCHRNPEPPIAAQHLDQVFSHDVHAKSHHAKIDDCTSCHALAPDGQVTPPGEKKDHKSCSAADCHQREFLNKGPKICGACHDTVSPWTKAPARVREVATSEYHEAIDHSAHLKPGTGATCETCHGDKMAGGKPPTGHKACAQCHNKQKNPPMTECAACHQRGAQGAKPPVSQWSVGKNFKHETHAMDRRNGGKTQCSVCHDQVQTAKDLASIPLPKMQRCDGCHDGKVAFKSTGFGCARCHAKADAK
jgi:hypothetical protein